LLTPVLLSTVFCETGIAADDPNVSPTTSADTERIESTQVAYAELIEQAPLERVLVRGFMSTPRGERQEERSYTALRLADGRIAMMSGLGRWQARFRGTGNAELKRNADGHPSLSWRTGWGVTYSAFVLQAPPAAGAAASVEDAVGPTFEGIDLATGVVFLSDPQLQPQAAVAVMPAVEIGQELVVLEHLPEALGRAVAVRQRSIAAVASYEAAGVDVAVLAETGDTYGVALQRDGSTLGLLAAVAGQQVILDPNDLQVLYQRAAQAWQEAGPAADVPESADQF
jgi:hypothetical protein